MAARDLNLALVEDREMVFCLDTFQEWGQKLVVKRWSMKSLPQSAFKKEVSSNGLEETGSPCEMVPLMYRRSLFKSWTWHWVGECMYLESLFTSYVISGLVRVKYWREPTIFLYRWAFLAGGETKCTSIFLRGYGLAIDLQLDILEFCKILAA